MIRPALTATAPLLAAALAPGEEAAAEGDTAGGSPGIRVRSTGLRSDQGQLACGLFVEENWLRAGAISGEAGAIDAAPGRAG